MHAALLRRRANATAEGSDRNLLCERRLRRRQRKREGAVQRSDEGSNGEGTGPTAESHLIIPLTPPLSRRERETFGYGSSSITILRYQASLGSPPWICRPMMPLWGIFASRSV